VKIGIIGTGIMGSAIARRLLASDASVVVCNRTPEKARILEAAGATVAGSPGAATRETDFVITCLTSASIVEEAVFGEHGIAETGSNAKLLIDMSSIDPGRTKVMAKRLRNKCGMGWVDAPLSGGAPAAAVGRMTLMLGGSEADIKRARPVLDLLSGHYTHLGANGAGQTVKLVNQLLCAIGFLGVAEAVHLAEVLGVDASAIPSALAGGRADSQILQEYMAKMATRDYSLTGRIDNMIKDLNAVAQAAGDSVQQLPLASLVTELNQRLLDAGYAAADSAEYMRLFDENILDKNNN
jgi:2-hydroxy-3-oxopropionate reductase